MRNTKHGHGEGKGPADPLTFTFVHGDGLLTQDSAYLQSATVISLSFNILIHFNFSNFLSVIRSISSMCFVHFHSLFFAFQNRIPFLSFERKTLIFLGSSVYYDLPSRRTFPTHKFFFLSFFFSSSNLG